MSRANFGVLTRKAPAGKKRNMPLRSGKSRKRVISDNISKLRKE